MKGSRAVGVVVALVALAAFGMVAGTAEAAPDVVSVDSIEVEVGREGTVSVRASDIAAPGLGVWTVDISYDTSVVDFVACVGDNGTICGPQFGPQTLRVTGASAAGLTGEATLAVVTFACVQEGVSELSISVDVWGQPSIDFGESPEIENGAVRCVEPSTPEATATAAPLSLPPTGTGASRGGSAIVWSIAVLAAAGAALVGSAALRRKGR